MAEPVDIQKIYNPFAASLYKRYREEIPEKSVKKIIDFLGEKFTASQCKAVDVGCGSGQSTIPFSPYLKEIIGIDSSEAQVAEILKEKFPENMTFRCGPAESLPVDNESVHLVTATYAAHWFDYPAFIKEVDRILIPGGVLAMTAADKPLHIFKNNEEAFEEILEELVLAADAYRNEKSRGWHKFYITTELPYKTFIRDHSVEIEMRSPLELLFNKIKTFSGIAQFFDKEPEAAEKAFQRFQNRVMKLLNVKSPAEEVTYIKRFITLMCRKPEN